MQTVSDRATTLLAGRASGNQSVRSPCSARCAQDLVMGPEINTVVCDRDGEGTGLGQSAGCWRRKAWVVRNIFFSYEKPVCLCARLQDYVLAVSVCVSVGGSHLKYSSYRGPRLRTSAFTWSRERTRSTLGAAGNGGPSGEMHIGGGV